MRKYKRTLMCQKIHAYVRFRLCLYSSVFMPNFVHEYRHEFSRSAVIF